jgi:murein DD-endopeptidase MepM/ murein hydrolase activator NlpD
MKTDDAHKAASQLEAFFLRQLLAEARPAGGGAIDGGFAGDTFKQMLDEAIADKMAARGGIGMAEMMAQQLAKAGTPGSIAPAGDPSVAVQLPPGLPALQVPVAGTPTSGFGMRTDPVHGGAGQMHPGFDLAAPKGTPVGAAAAGKVVSAGVAGGYGNLIIVDHGNGYTTRYGHLSAIDVKVGDQVTPGQIIGAVGSTGYSTGPHLHFEVRHNGDAMDPEPMLPIKRAGKRPNR